MTSLRRSLVCRGTRVDESGFVCEYGGLGAVVVVELVEDAYDVGASPCSLMKGISAICACPSREEGKARGAGVFDPKEDGAHRS